MSKTGKSHKKQHFVPQCYTKAWHDPTAPAGPKNAAYVWVFDRDGSNARRKAPANIFTETDIYTITRPDGERDLRLEHGFQELEDKFTRIRNLKFRKRIWPNAEDLAWLFSFVATAQARTAAHRNFHRQQWARIRERMEEVETAFRKSTPARQAAMAQVSRGGATSRSDEGLSIEDVRLFEDQPIQKMLAATIRAVIPIFGRMHVCVLCTDDPIGFVTSDRPCNWFDPNAYKRQPIFRSPGLSSSTIEVTLPISPKQCLLITHNSEYRGYVDVEQLVVDELNYRHISHCNENFISQNQTTRNRQLKAA